MARQPWLALYCSAHPPVLLPTCRTASHTLLPHRYGIRLLVIDPYNELNAVRPGNMTESEYVSGLMAKLRQFAQHFEVAVWLVAHPRQLQQWGGEPPDIYSISGSAHFINKADNVLVVHRWVRGVNKHVCGCVCRQCGLPCAGGAV